MYSACKDQIYTETQEDLVKCSVLVRSDIHRDTGGTCKMLSACKDQIYTEIQENLVKCTALVRSDIN
jgi:hypothetical protein